MNPGLAIAGLICLGLAFGHATIGLAWVLPGLTVEHLPSTPFGPPSMTEGMLRVTWHIVTVFVLAVGTLLLTVAWAAPADTRTLLLHWFAMMFLAATAMVFYVARRRPRSLLRLPVWSLWVMIAVLCWLATLNV
jgi:hypothetical protein